MSGEQKPKSSPLNGRLWGARARDWADIQEGQCRPVYEAVFAHLGLGANTQYCDVGCGAGMAAQIAASRGAQVSGVDAAPALLEIARSRVPKGDFRAGDIEELPFADQSFDVVTGFNAFQYAANPGTALAAAKRVTRKGGRVVIMTWGKPEGMEAAALVGALKPLLPPPPPGAPGPFALSDESALRMFAAAAELQAESVHDVPCHFFYPDLATGLRGLGSAGVAVRAMENSSVEALNNAHTDALAPFRQPDGSYRIGATFRFLVTRV